MGEKEWITCDTKFDFSWDTEINLGINGIKVRKPYPH